MCMLCAGSQCGEDGDADGWPDDRLPCDRLVVESSSSLWSKTSETWILKNKTPGLYLTLLSCVGLPGKCFIIS